MTFKDFLIDVLRDMSRDDLKDSAWCYAWNKYPEQFERYRNGEVEEYVPDTWSDEEGAMRKKNAFDFGMEVFRKEFKEFFGEEF